MNISRNSTVAQIVVQHVVAARVFQKHQIDFCCHGNVSVPEACAARQIDPETVYEELEAAIPGAAAEGDDPRTLSTATLIARIIDRHHGYIRRAIPFIAPLAAKVAAVHGEHNTKLLDLNDTFVELANALMPHVDDEEAVLFPALMTRTPDRAVVRKELASMYEDHVAVGKLLARIRELSDGFTTPEWGCNSYRVYITELAGLEEDVLRHVHLENHVLMPRFVEEGEPARVA